MNNTESDTVFTLHAHPGMLRVGPWMPKSRKRRRHVIRQWRMKLIRDGLSTDILSATCEHDTAGLPVLVTTFRDRRTGIEHCIADLLLGESTGVIVINEP